MQAGAGDTVPKLNAIDAISPAMQLTKANLLPFRWRYWWRVALLGLLTGEMSSGNGCNFNIPSNFPPPQSQRGDFLAISPPFGNVDPHVLWVLLPFLLVTGLSLMLIFMYIGSVSRFMLVEAVLNGEIRLRESFTRWQNHGWRVFLFNLVLVAIFLVLVALMLIPVIMLVGISNLGNPNALNAGGVIATLIFFALGMFLLFIPYMIVFVLAKDFSVPIMALENLNFSAAWRRAWGITKSELGSVAGYLGMKIVLTIAAGIIFGIIGVIVILIFLLPVGGVGFLTIMAGKAAGMTWNLYTITLAVAAGIVAFALLMVIISIISTPVATFFPTYGLYFLAGRCQPLHDRLFPPPPPAPPVVEPPPAPETPPMPPEAPPQMA